MKITKEWLLEVDACEEAIEPFEQMFPAGAEIKAVCKKALSMKHFDWANWLIAHIMSSQQCIQYAVYAAEQVLYIWEARYPNDNSPRAAIEAAKKVLEDNTQENKNATSFAAANAATAAFFAASNASNASNAAFFAAYAANAANATDAEIIKTNAATAAFFAASFAAATAKNIKARIITFGLSLLEEGNICDIRD